MNNSFQNFLVRGFEKIDQDHAYLLECVSEVLEEIGEPELARLLQSRSWPEGEALPERGAQALSVHFQLLNLVEEHTANQVMQWKEEQGKLEPGAGRWYQELKALKEAGADEAALLAKLKTVLIESVMTAHPTEAKRWTVLDQHRELFLELAKRDHPGLSRREQEGVRRRIKAALERLWRTGEILLGKPDVATERRNLLYYFQEKLPEAVRRMDERFMDAWKENGFDPLVLYRERAYPKVRFGSWVGGDSDGHPFVTPEVTHQTLQELRGQALSSLSQQLETLERSMGLSVHVQLPDESFLQRIAAMEAETRIPWREHFRGTDAGVLATLPRAGRLAEGEGEALPEEPWKVFVRYMRWKVELAEDEQSRGGYRYVGELRQDLEMLYGSLEQVRAHRLARDHVYPFLRYLAVFGFHSARLDIRQNSAFHDKAAAQMMQAAGIEGGGDFADWSEDRRVAFLTKELRNLRPLTHPLQPLGEEAERIRRNYTVLADWIQRHGRAGLGYLIVSMTRKLSDLLLVYLFCREAGMLRRIGDKLVCPMPVVPLFETVDDLNNGASILGDFFKHDITRASLPWQGPDQGELWFDYRNKADEAWKLDSKARLVQPVMVGYSDSNKDGVIVASLWALNKSQRELIRMANTAGVELLFFHGRGGTISRGAGPMHRFLESLPLGERDPGCRVTEQGEVIAQKFNNAETGALQLELLAAGTLAHPRNPVGANKRERLGNVLDYWAREASEHYRELIRQPGFMKFFRQATPIDVIEQSRIGSRPSRRTGSQRLEDLRAIPWVFSWNQSRFYLPGWFGAGKGLAKLRSEQSEHFEFFKKHWAEWPLMRYLLYNIESSIESADTDIMTEYSSLVEDEEVRMHFHNWMTKEYEQTRSLLNEVMGDTSEERRPRFFKTLHARDDSLMVLHREQIRLLRAWREQGGDGLLNALQVTVNAIASGLRTTG